MLNRAAALIGFLAMLVLLDGCRAIPVASAMETRMACRSESAAGFEQQRRPDRTDLEVSELEQFGDR